MGVRSIRIPEEMEIIVEYVAKKEKIEKSQCLRKLTRMGFENYVARSYEKGEITLRKASNLLGENMWEAIEIMKNLGVKGNVGAKEILSSLEYLKNTHSIT